MDLGPWAKQITCSHIIQTGLQDGLQVLTGWRELNMCRETVNPEFYSSEHASSWAHLGPYTAALRCECTVAWSLSGMSVSPWHKSISPAPSGRVTGLWENHSYRVCLTAFCGSFLIPSPPHKRTRKKGGGGGRKRGNRKGSWKGRKEWGPQAYCFKN